MSPERDEWGNQGCRETDRGRCQIQQKKMPEDARFEKGKNTPQYFSSEQFYCIFINKSFPDFLKSQALLNVCCFLQVGSKLQCLPKIIKPQ